MASDGARAAAGRDEARRDPEWQSRNPCYASTCRGVPADVGEAGWREGRNISFDVRWGGADTGRIDAYAAELVKLNPDVILATNTPRRTRSSSRRITIPCATLPPIEWPTST